jgi:hypothetical protein
MFDDHTRILHPLAGATGGHNGQARLLALLKGEALFG